MPPGSRDTPPPPGARSPGTRVHERSTAGRRGAIERRSPIDQEPDQRLLDTGDLWVKARRDKTQRGRTRVHLRNRIDFRTRIEQGLRNRHGVPRRVLTEGLDAVGADVVQQRRTMAPRRSRGKSAQDSRPATGQRDDVPTDGRLDGGLEAHQATRCP